MQDDPIQTIHRLEDSLFDTSGDSSAQLRQELEADGVDVNRFLSRLRGVVRKGYQHQISAKENLDMRTLTHDLQRLSAQLQSLSQAFKATGNDHVVNALYDMRATLDQLTREVGCLIEPDMDSLGGRQVYIARRLYALALLYDYLQPEDMNRLAAKLSSVWYVEIKSFKPSSPRDAQAACVRAFWDTICGCFQSGGAIHRIEAIYGEQVNPPNPTAFSPWDRVDIFIQPHNCVERLVLNLDAYSAHKEANAKQS